MFHLWIALHPRHTWQNKISGKEKKSCSKGNPKRGNWNPEPESRIQQSGIRNLDSRYSLLLLCYSLVFSELFDLDENCALARAKLNKRWVTACFFVFGPGTRVARSHIEPARKLWVTLSSHPVWIVIYPMDSFIQLLNN